MSFTIRERCRKVAECVSNKGLATIESIAKVTGLSKSSVHRHKQAIAQRNHYSESEGWQCHFMVSDSAPGLIKLALSGLNCVSVPDLFHALRGLARPIGSGIGRQIARLHKKLSTLQQQLLITSVEDKRQILQQSIDIINLELQIQEQAQQQYNQSLHSITLAVHPFDIDTQEWQLSSTLSSCLNAPMTVLSATLSPG